MTHQNLSLGMCLSKPSCTRVPKTWRLCLVMGSSVSGQDDLNRALWLATRAGKMEPSCPLGTTRCIPQAKYIHSRHVFSTRVHEGLLKHIPRLRFWCVIITTLYQLMLQSWYRKTAQSLVNTLVLFWHGEIFFLLWNCDKQNEMQLLAKFKQILYMGFRATLNFRKSH